MKYLTSLMLFSSVVLFSCQEAPKSTQTTFKIIIHELNESEIPAGDKLVALVGATLIDGRGGAPLENACIIIRNEKIEAVGKNGKIDIPSAAEVIDVSGLTVFPG